MYRIVTFLSARKLQKLKMGGGEIPGFFMNKVLFWWLTGKRLILTEFLKFAAILGVKSNGCYIIELLEQLKVMECYIFQLFRALEVTGRFIFQLLEALHLTAVSFTK